MVETGELGPGIPLLPTGRQMTNIRIILFLLTGTLFFFLVLRFQGKQIQTSASPAGIVSFELAGTAQETTQMLDAWKQASAMGSVRMNILIDFLFIPFYALLFYTLCGSISVRHHGKAASLGVLLAFFSLIAALFDILENLLMLAATYGYYNDTTALLTAFFAAAKFSLLALSLLYVVLLGLPLLIKKISNASRQLPPPAL
jgi:hypothetical protein